MKEGRRRLRKVIVKLKAYFNCMYIPLEEEDVIHENNCVVFKGLKAEDPIGEICHIGHILFKVLRTNFDVKRIVHKEEQEGGVVMVVEFTETIMATFMLQKAEMVLPTIKTERYVKVVPVRTDSSKN